MKLLMIVVLTTCSLFFFTNKIQAQDNIWRCIAYDVQNSSWEGHSNYQLRALNRASEACKKQSRFPSSCKAAKQDCEAINNNSTTSTNNAESNNNSDNTGLTIRPMWRCMALDEAAIPWFSNFYDQAIDAVFAAKSYCQANSALPETCYVYPFTCRNLNPRTF